MREYIISLGSVMMLIAFSNILLPEGSIKKFASLAMGFMLISTAIAPLPSRLEDIKIDAQSFVLDEGDIAAAQAQYKAQILKRQREILADKISEYIKHGSKVYVQTSPDGEIISVTLSLKGDESSAIAYITDTLKVPRERIKLFYENN